jgi:hypothetical protein
MSLAVPAVAAAEPQPSRAPAQGAPEVLTRTALTSAKKSKKVRRKVVRRKTVRPAVAPAPAAAVPLAAAPAPTTPVPATPEAVGALALAKIAAHVDPAKLGVSVVFSGTHPSYLGLFQSASRTVNVYVRPGQTVESVAWVLAHELGHAIDVFTFAQDDRNAWAAARGFDPAMWWPGVGATNDQSSGAGDFAESFALFAAGSGLTFRSNLGPSPSWEQLAVIPSLIDAAR